MIDKNDVKMPVQKENMEDLLKDEAQVRRIEDLLDLVSAAENRQELRLKGDYYGKFHWFGANTGKNDKSYFSYQEEAVYDFIFNLNKSGILSDQVGMGKTIEAGMIISELASRNELRSLLIVVPNEIMAQKWEYELEDKFGIKPLIRYNDSGVREEFPQVKAIKNYEDFCRCIFECTAEPE
jgi:superfamily II DNA or RNA helicase